MYVIRVQDSSVRIEHLLTCVLSLETMDTLKFEPFNQIRNTVKPSLVMFRKDISCRFSCEILISIFQIFVQNDTCKIFVLLHHLAVHH